MSNRDYKQFASDCYYHVYNRGNGKQKIFLRDYDFRVFLYRLKENLFSELYQKQNSIKPAKYQRHLLPEGTFTLLSYCLMPNHFHLLIRQNTSLALNELLKRVCVGYAKYFNKTYKKTGSLFEHKFRSVQVDSDGYLLWLSAYIHQNPKVASLVKNLREWPYSSYLDYVGERSGKLCDKSVILDQFQSKKDYKSFVEESFVKVKGRKDIEKLLIDEETAGR